MRGFYFTRSTLPRVIICIPSPFFSLFVEVVAYVPVSQRRFRTFLEDWGDGADERRQSGVGVEKRTTSGYFPHLFIDCGFEASFPRVFAISIQGKSESGRNISLPQQVTRVRKRVFTGSWPCSTSCFGNEVLLMCLLCFVVLQTVSVPSAEASSRMLGERGYLCIICLYRFVFSGAGRVHRSSSWMFDGGDATKQCRVSNMTSEA